MKITHGHEVNSLYDNDEIINKLLLKVEDELLIIVKVR